MLEEVVAQHRSDRTQTIQTIKKSDLEDLRWVAREAVATATTPGCEFGLDEELVMIRRAWALGAIGPEYDLPVPGAGDDLGDSVGWPLELDERHLETLREAAGALEALYASGMDGDGSPAERAAFYGTRSRRAARARAFLEKEVAAEAGRVSRRPDYKGSTLEAGAVRGGWSGA